MELTGQRTVSLTAAEVKELQRERVRAISECPATRLSDAGHYAVGSNRVRGILHIAGRDRDGCILAKVRVFGGRPDAPWYLRRLRISPKPGKRDVKLLQNSY